MCHGALIQALKARRRTAYAHKPVAEENPDSLRVSLHDLRNGHLFGDCHPISPSILASQLRAWVPTDASWSTSAPSGLALKAMLPILKKQPKRTLLGFPYYSSQYYTPFVKNRQATFYVNVIDSPIP